MCKSLRAAVDKFGIDIDFVKFQVDGFAELNLNGQKIKYAENGGTGTIVTFNGQEKIFPGENFISIAFKDLELLLKNSISTLELFMPEHVPLLLEVLRKAGPVHTEHIKLSRFSIEEAHSILPYFNAQKLEKIEIFLAQSSEGFDRIRDLEQWKNLKSFTFYSIAAPLGKEQIEHMFRFENFNIAVDKFLVQDAIRIRDVSFRQKLLI